jgi:hypothetical protein
VQHSYIVVNKATGKAVLEFFDVKLSRHINTDTHTILTALAYLSALNRTIKEQAK